MPTRRSFHGWLASALINPLTVHAAPGDMTTLALAWRGPREHDAHHVGRLRVGWASRHVTTLWATALPSRPHGLLAEPDGALLVVARRPGRWLMRIDARGHVQARRSIDDEPDGHRLDGHVIASADGRWLLTTQSDPATGQGFIAVRDRDTLAVQSRWPTHGIDPHQLLLDGDDHLMVANGGIPRDAAGRKRDLDRMQPSLVRMDAGTGALRGQWRLADPRLSLRHMAFSTGEGPRRLGIALQAEHDDPVRRADAPLLALWDGQALMPATRAAGQAGYAGDITPAPGGGFLVSAQRANQVLHWQPAAEAPWSIAGRLTDACALAAGPADAGRLMLGALGIGLWHPERPAAMLAWPQPMAVDNHCVLIESATA